MENLIDRKAYFDHLRSYDLIYLWGCGSKGVQTLSLLRKEGIEPKAFIDSNKGKHGRIVEGIPVIDYSEAKKTEKEYCILITTVWNYACEIKEMLSKEPFQEKNEVISCINPFKMECKFLEDDGELVKKVEDNLNLLADEESKELFIRHINWKMIGDVFQMVPYLKERSMIEWLDEEMIPVAEDYTYVDIGAYTGDTVVQFMAFSRMKYHKVIAIEPDRTSAEIMKKCFDYLDINKKCEIIQKGVGAQKQTLTFYKSADKEFESANFLQECKNIISIDRLEGKEETVGELVECDLLDNLLQNENGNLLIKLDTQGMEYECLLGAKQTLAKKQPILMLEIGTFSENMFDVLPLIHEQNPNYSFYIRQRIVGENSRSFVYAIPKKG